MFSQNQLPSNIDAEMEILGGILLDPEAMGRVADSLPPEAFYVKAHQKIYQVAFDLYNEGKTTDLMSVTTALSDQNQLEKIGGNSVIAGLLNRTVSSVNIDRYAELLKDKWIRRKLISAAHAILDLGYAVDQELETVLDQSRARLDSVIENSMPTTLAHISESVVQSQADYELAQKGELETAIETGFKGYDDLDGGLRKRNLIYLAARPSVGKTCLGLQIAAQVAREGTVAFFSLEMGKKQLTNRLVSLYSGIPGSRVRDNEIFQDEIDKYASAHAEVMGLGLHVSEKTDVTTTGILSSCRCLKAETGRLDLVVVDYLQLMHGADSENQNVAIGKISRHLKIIAGELDTTVLCLSQLSRACENTSDGKPQLHHLRGSGSTEQDADLVWLLHRDKSNSPDLAELNVAKNRDGATGTIHFQFTPHLTRFEAMPTEEFSYA